MTLFQSHCQQSSRSRRIEKKEAETKNGAARAPFFLLARDVQDAQVPRRPWMAESGPGEMGVPLRGDAWRLSVMGQVLRTAADSFDL
jgi:hypothetical protein